MTALLIVGLVLSVALNVFLAWYAIQAAMHLRDVSENISIFWAELIEYKEFLDGLMDMHAYTDDGTVKSFVEATKRVLKEINEFRDFCELADILTEEELSILEEMEDEYEEQKENVMEDKRGNEHVREWDRETVPSKTTRLRSG